MLAGQNAVQNMRRAYAEDATKFLDTWGNQLTGSASNIADYEYKDKALASDERIAQMSADTQKAVAQIEADAASKGYSAETINTIISGVTALILNGKSYAALQGFLDQYGIKLPEQPVTTTDTVVPSGLGGLTKGGLAGLTEGTGNTKPGDTKPGDTKDDDTKPDGDATGNDVILQRWDTEEILGKILDDKGMTAALAALDEGIKKGAIPKHQENYFKIWLMEKEKA